MTAILYALVVAAGTSWELNITKLSNSREF